MANIIKRVWNQNRMVQIEDLKGMTFQAEQAGHTFQISGIDDDGNTVALTGTPAGVLLRPDNTDVALTCSVSGGVVSATLPANCYDVPGRFGLTIFITSGSSKTAIYAAVGTVSRTSSGSVAPGTSQSVVDLINAINAAVNSIPASYSDLLADIAPTYSNSALYSVGQYAWYDGDLKRCIVPITTSESYTAAHWTSAVLGQDVSDLKSALSGTTRNLVAGILQNCNMNSSGLISANTDYDMVYAPVENGKTYIVSTNDTLEKLVCGFFTSIPEIGSTASSGRIIDDDKIITSSINGYIAFRVMAGYAYAQIEEGTIATTYIAPITAVDRIVRENSYKNSSIISEQEKNTKEFIYSLCEIELLIKNAMKDGYLINAQTGDETANVLWSSSEFIPVIPGIPIKVTNGHASSNVAFYDSSKTYVNNSGFNCGENDFIVPNESSIAYMRWCTSMARKTNASLKYELVKSPFDQIYNYLYKNDLLYKNRMIDGVYVKQSTGELDTNENYSTSDWINVIPNMEISVIGGASASQVAYYDSNKNYVSGQVVGNNSFTVPSTSTIAYMRWCTNIANKSTAALINVIDDSYIINSGDNLLHGVIQAYTLRKKKIVVNPGVYNVIDDYEEEFGSDYFELYNGYSTDGSKSVYARGIWIDNIEIQFRAGAKVVANYQGENESVTTYFSPFAVGSHAIIDGLVLDSRNLRYAIHPDFHPDAEHEEVIIRNCDLKNEGGKDQAIGAGLGIHSLWIIENCIFRSIQGKIVLRIHNNYSEYSESKVIIRNCYIDGSGYFRFNSLGNYQTLTNILVSGCSWVTPPAVGLEKPLEYQAVNMKLFSCCNETRQE